jgi:hypothetical protein
VGHDYCSLVDSLQQRSFGVTNGAATDPDERGPVTAHARLDEPLLPKNQRLKPHRYRQVLSSLM